MADALILEFTGMGLAQYDAVNEQLGIDMRTGQGDWPAGLLCHAAGTTDDGSLVVMEVWSSRAQQQEFMQSRLGAALAAGGIDVVPSVRWVPLASFQLLGA